MTRSVWSRVKSAIERHFPYKMSVSIEVIPVPEDQVEADPDRYEDMIEVKVEWL
jgi:hypothetical protein